LIFISANLAIRFHTALASQTKSNHHAGMKANQLLLLLLFLMLGVAAAEQNNSASSVTNSGTIAELKANAEKGDADAQFNLGAIYDEGKDVAQNYAEAVKWFRKAAEQGDARAQNNLGSYYAKGYGVAKDDTEAVKWYRKAAVQGNAVAQYDFAACLWNGDGIPVDFVEAYKWCNLASAQGYDRAKETLRTFAQFMSSEQVAEAQRLSREFVPRKETPSSRSDNSSSPDSPLASGTGFFITDDGYLISNYHVVKDATKVRLITSAGLIDAKVVQVDAANDLALLKAVGRFAPLPIAASRTVNLGGTVATVGFPNIGMQGFAPKLAKGEIASLSGAADDPRYFQISVPVQPGNSGGALVDERGNVIGIVSAKLDAGAALAASGALPENVNYAVKSSFLLSFLESVPAVSAKLKAPVMADRKFEDVVKSAQDAAVLVLVY
jgi:S1-C subfamily serine protease